MNVGGLLSPNELNKMLKEINIELTQEVLDRTMVLAKGNGECNS